MTGAVAGDVIGSVFESAGIKTVDFPLFSPYSRFTDDTVLTVAVAKAILTGAPYDETLRDFARRHPDAGYGAMFVDWFSSDDNGPYNSWGNGAAMRVSPVGYAFDTVEDVLEEARLSAAVTHDHPEGIKGAQAVALAIFMARTGSMKDEIREEISARFSYDLNRTLDGIRPGYGFDVSSSGSVPESIIAFLESTGYESAVRGAVSLGGDSDTMACIAGAIAEAFYGAIPEEIVRRTRAVLPTEFLGIMDEFNARYRF